VHLQRIWMWVVMFHAFLCSIGCSFVACEKKNLVSMLVYCVLKKIMYDYLYGYLGNEVSLTFHHSHCNALHLNQTQSKISHCMNSFLLCYLFISATRPTRHGLTRKEHKIKAHAKLQHNWAEAITHTPTHKRQNCQWHRWKQLINNKHFNEL